jgi:SAM-dependent methyltransferase
LFKDHFSTQAEVYRRYRPDYPPELFAWLATLPRERRSALDCATGNGQAAIGLAAWYERVIALDASVAQLGHAMRHDRVCYVANEAERLALRAASIDLVTVAQGVHWFDFESFFAEATRVLVDGGVIAIWTYQTFSVDALIDAIVTRFYHEVVGPFWPPERRYVETGYRDVPFPYEPIAVPDFNLRARWTLANVLGYVGSWSAVQRYRTARGEDPVPLLARELEPHWGAGTRELLWPLHLRAGRR